MSLTRVDTETGEVVVLFDKAQARVLTAKIRDASDSLWKLLAQAHDREAWRALGYDSFKSYVRVEFDMSKSRAYQLLDQARVVAALTEGESTIVDPNEGVTREFAPMLDDPDALLQVAETAAGNAETPGKPTAEEVALAREQSEWAARQRDKRDRDNQAAAQEKAVKASRDDFDKRLTKARPLLDLDPLDVAVWLANTDIRSTRSTLLDLAGWATDLAERLDPNETLRSM